MKDSASAQNITVAFYSIIPVLRDSKCLPQNFEKLRMEQYKIDFPFSSVLSLGVYNIFAKKKFSLPFAIM